MEAWQELLVALWRAAGRQADMTTTVRDLVVLLSPWMPLGGFLVQCLDLERSCMETIGGASEGGVPAEIIERRDCSAGHLQELLVWCRHGGVALQPPGEPLPGALAVVVPPGLTGDVLIGPLLHEPAAAGVVVACAAPGQRFTPQHQRIVQVLLEPLSIALAHDQRRRELNALRAVADAEKQSLLRRLGREEVHDTIVGAEGRLRPVMERVELVSRSDVPVLLLGETGAGKEVIARAIHTRSARASAPFLRVNCGAIPPDLLDSELFGHERGSFTGATGTRRGWFERADAGTLFLDEIGELSLAAQVRLLRVVQEGTFERVGGERAVKVDVRIVAATHRDLAAMVQHGTFREDLWYRIAVFPIVLPPLREHPEDIAALAEHFARRAAVRFGLPLQLPSPHDIGLLSQYAWPGNVRELATVIDRAVILGTGQRLEVAKALGVIPTVRSVPQTVDPTPVLSPSTATTILPLDAAMKQHIETALTATCGRVEGPHGAARLLGVNPHTLRGRMRKLGIVWEQFRVSGL